MLLTFEELNEFLLGKKSVPLEAFPTGMALNLQHYKRQALRFKPVFDEAIKTGKNVELTKDDSNIVSFKQRIGEGLRLLSLLNREYKILRESVVLKVTDDFEKIIITFKPWAISLDFKQAISSAENKAAKTKTVVFLDEIKAFLNNSSESVKQWKFIPSDELEDIKAFLSQISQVETNIQGNTLTIVKY